MKVQQDAYSPACSQDWARVLLLRACTVFKCAPLSLFALYAMSRSQALWALLRSHHQPNGAPHHLPLCRLRLQSTPAAAVGPITCLVTPWAAHLACQHLCRVTLRLHIHPQGPALACLHAATSAEFSDCAGRA